MQLNDIQKNFLHLMLSPEAIKTMPDMFGREGVPVDARLDVYRKAVLGRLEDVIRAT